MTTTNSGTTEPQIPSHLLDYNPDDWPEPTGVLATGTPWGADLHKREQWRQARQTWGAQHGMDWQAFSLAATRQQHERRIAAHRSAVPTP